MRRLLTDSSINVKPCIFTLQFWHNIKTNETKAWVAENFINNIPQNNSSATSTSPTIISLIHDLNGNFVTGYKYYKGKRLKKISKEVNSSNLGSGRTSSCNSISFVSYNTECTGTTSETGGYNMVCWSVATYNTYIFCSFGGGGNNEDQDYDFGNGGGGGGGGGGDNGNGDPNEGFDENTVFEFASGPAINLNDHLNCFGQVPDAGATYSVTISTDIPDNSNPNIVAVNSNVGHSFLTFTKSNGGQTVTKSFGFYPKIGWLSVVWGYVDSKIVNDGGHVFDASYTLSNLSSANFNAAMFLSKTLANNLDYSLNNFNCTDYALQVMNSIMSQPLNVPDHITPGKNWGTTPGGLFKAIQQRSATDPNASLSSGTSASPTGPCP